MYTINDLYDLDQTIAAGIFENKTYPWEVLADIGDYIIKLGNSLDENEYEKKVRTYGLQRVHQWHLLHLLTDRV